MTDWTAGCHCGAVSVRLARAPDEVAECNCSLCLSHGVLWSYFSPREVVIEGATRVYRRGDMASPACDLHFCGHCGCTTHWSATAELIAIMGEVDRMGVNMRLFDPGRLRGLRLMFPDGRGWDKQGDWAFARPDGVMA